MDDARIVNDETYGMSKEDVKYVTWYEGRMDELCAEWLETINPEDFEEYWDYVYDDFDRTSESLHAPDERVRSDNYDQWYRVNAIILQSQWSASIDPTDFNQFWSFVERTYDSYGDPDC